MKVNERVLQELETIRVQMDRLLDRIESIDNHLSNVDTGLDVLGQELEDARKEMPDPTDLQEVVDYIRRQERLTWTESTKPAF